MLRERNQYVCRIGKMVYKSVQNFPRPMYVVKMLTSRLFSTLLTEDTNSSNCDNSSNPGESASTGISGDHAGVGDEWDSDLPGGGEMELDDLSGIRYDAREQLLSPEIQEEASCHNGQF